MLTGLVGADGANAEPADDGVESSEPLVIVIGGDLGLGGSRQPISATGGYRHGRLMPWTTLTAGIAPLLDGDINFANLETVVSDRRRLRPTPKAFNFMMHPNGVRHLVGVGFNVFSTANNHAIDFGQEGLRQTLGHLADLRGAGLLAAPGIGRGRANAMAPSLVRRKGRTIAISALGIGGGRLAAGSRRGRIGQMAYNAKDDFADTVTALGAQTADYRILSVHYGRERAVRPSRSAVAKLRDVAVRNAGIDLVVGHHAHVAAGVQQVDGKVIFYGLGNLLHLGMQDMAKFGPCRDYGLMARVYVAAGDDGRLHAYAIEAVPLTRMHDAARPMTGAKAARRIAMLNGLARGLDDAAGGARGLRFVAQADGSGLHCLPGADGVGGRVAQLCRGWQAPERKAYRRTAACGYVGQVAGRTKRRRAHPRYRRAKAKDRRRAKAARDFRTVLWRGGD